MQDPRGDEHSDMCLARAEGLEARRGALEWCAAEHLNRLAAAPYAADADAERRFVPRQVELGRMPVLACIIFTTPCLHSRGDRTHDIANASTSVGMRW